MDQLVNLYCTLICNYYSIKWLQEINITWYCSWLQNTGDKQILKNCRPVSLLPVCRKIFERLIFNELLNFLLENNLISRNQSGFKPEESCLNQLLSITHEIYNLFDEGLEVRSVFFDISKVFDKVWHKGVLFKLSQNVISGNLSGLLSSFFEW